MSYVLYLLSNKKCMKYISCISVIIAIILSGCTIRFTMNGASVPDNLKTFSVEYFENRAPQINPTLSQNFTEGLKDRITSESRLELSDGNGDVVFSGQITGYDTKPMAIQENAESAETRLTITIKVRYQNSKDPKTNWESSFSAYQDYDSSEDLSDVEDDLTDLIVEDLTEDVFNKAFSDW